MRSIRITAPRPFWKAYRFFTHAMLWWWFGGIGVCLLMAALHASHAWVTAVGLLTIFPVLIGWLGFNGVGILLTTMPQLHPRRDAPREPMDRVALAVWVLTGMVFTAFAAAALVAIVWRVVR
jgi:hypothetical protein